MLLAIYTALDRLVHFIATSVQKPEDHTRMILCLVLQTPIGWFMNMFITKPGLPRYLYSMVMGFLLLNYMFRETTYHVYIYAVCGYLIMNIFPRNKQHYVMMAFVICYMSSQHIYSMMTDFGGFHMDITTYTMILVCKLWVLAWEYKDGGEDPKNLTPY